MLRIRTTLIQDTGCAHGITQPGSEVRMSIPRRTRFGIGALVALLIAVVPGAVQAQTTGTITGQVVDVATNQPLVGVQMVVAGTNLGSLTNQEGRYIITNVPAGQREVRAALIGYSGARQTVTLAAGETAVADFTLRESAIELEGLMVTATGREQRRREVGSTVAQINMEEVNLGPVQTFSQLLQGRAAGVQVLQSAGTSGTGARVRIRGSASISLSNEPLLIVDGIQVDNTPQSQTFGLGGQTVSRLNDLRPEEIENIEILKGPAASALYGTAAANGVIQVTTKRGRAGPTRWNVYTEYGQINDVTTYPANWRQLGTSTATGAVVVCRTYSQAAGTCTPTEVQSWNPLMEVPPFRTGSSRIVGANVRGGSEQVQFFISGESDQEDGIYQSNWVNRVSVRGNLDAQLHPTLNVSLRTGYLDTDMALPGNDNNTFGFIGAGLLGAAVDDEFRRGMFGFPNEYRFALERMQKLNRFISSLDANWRPLDWLTITGTGGMDFMNRDEESGVAPGIWSPATNPDNAIGNRFVFSGLIRNYTARSNAIAVFPVSDEIQSITTLGGEFREDRFQRSDAGGFNMLPGTRSLGSLSERFSVNELDRTTRTVSGMASQQFGWRDRVFLTASVRGDRNSNFGQEFGFQWYPAFSASWVVGEEEWFPQTDWVSSLRLRTAWGRSGLMPTFRAADLFYDASVATFRGASVPAITVGGAGNPDLRPEQSQEWELGFDAGIFEDRLGVEVAYYNKTSTDALVQRRLAPSLGSSVTQWINLARVQNQGWEAILNARILQMGSTRWDATLGFSTNRNELLELGEGIEPIIFGIGGDSQRHAEGHPLGHYYGLRILGWEDSSGDGVLALGDVQLSDEPEVLGNPFPRRELSFSSTLSLFNNVRLFALLEHKGGHQLFNSTEEFRCGAFVNCRALNDPTAPLEEQARAIAAWHGAIDGYVEDADFTKLREASLTIFGLDRYLARAGVGGLNDVSLTLSGRNLATWTDYTGLDPEMNSGGQVNFSTYEFLGQPPVRTWTVRVNVGF
jgi:TonB-dependent starch-binding outer membrane protein SusC